ncbi:MAG: tripartite tricarboxylate transporter permease [Candidatus Methanomethylicaceae archaeon]
MIDFSLLIFTVYGVIVAAFLAMIPGLHVYNMVALLLLMTIGTLVALPEIELVLFMFGLLVGYSVMNSISSVFFSIPDDSTIFTVFPSQRFMLQRRGFEASLLTGIGGLMGAGVLVMCSLPIPGLNQSLLTFVLAPLHILLTDHLAWIILAITLFMLLIECPKDIDRGGTPLYRLVKGWTPLLFGLLAFCLSAILGFIITYKPLIPVERSFQNIMPALIGLFGLPFVTIALLNRTEVPKQHIPKSIDLDVQHILKGTTAGTIGGLIAAFFPAVTGGMGSLIAGHTTAQRDDRIFMISQGATKVIYYVGAALLLFVPGVEIIRGAGASMISAVFTPEGYQDFYLVAGAIGLAGVLSFVMLIVMSVFAAKIVEQISYRLLNIVTLVIQIVLVILIAGPVGIFIAAVAWGIGLIPHLYFSRVTNNMAVLIVPIVFNMAGIGDAVAEFLHLL